MPWFTVRLAVWLSITGCTKCTMIGAFKLLGNSARDSSVGAGAPVEGRRFAAEAVHSGRAIQELSPQGQKERYQTEMGCCLIPWSRRVLQKFHPFSCGRVVSVAEKLQKDLIGKDSGFNPTSWRWFLGGTRVFFRWWVEPTTLWHRTTSPVGPPKNRPKKRPQPRLRKDKDPTWWP